MTKQEREHLIVLGVYLDAFRREPYQLVCRLLACEQCELNGSDFCLKCPASLYDGGTDGVLSLIDRMLDEDDNLQTLIRKAQQQPSVRECVELMEYCSWLNATSNATSRVCPNCGGTGRVAITEAEE